MADEEKPYDSSDPKQVKLRTSKVKLDAERITNFIRDAVMSHADGRRWVWQLLADTHVNHTSFNTNALTMAMLEGERNVGLRLQAQIIAASPKAFMQMLEENGGNK